MKIINKNTLPIILILILCSGWAALVYQILWLKQLSLLFGNSSQAIATVISVFFLGTAVGSTVWGRLSAKLQSPWLVFGLLEFGIAITALACYFLNDWYALLLALPNIGEPGSSLIALLTKFSIAFILLFPSSFLMGGTIPMLSQALIKNLQNFGRTASLLIAVNTLGAAAGAISAGFVLLEKFGVSTVYLIAMSINITIGVIVLSIKRQLATLMPEEHQYANEQKAAHKTEKNKHGKNKSYTASLALESKDHHPHNSLEVKFLWLIVFMSGTLTMAVEVLWVRIFSFVMESTVFTHSFIIGTFLLALGIGNLLAYCLYRYQFKFWASLCVLLFSSACFLGITPAAFNWLSNSLQPLVMGNLWVDFLSLLFFIILIPGIILGSIFPFLLKSLSGDGKAAGKIVGQCLLVNTIGALIGPLMAGFILPGTLGIWNSFKLLAFFYAVTGIFVLYLAKLYQSKLSLALSTSAIVLLLFSHNVNLPVFWLNSEIQEKVLSSWEGSYGAVGVMEAEQEQLGHTFTDRYIRVNNTYTLGGLGSEAQENRQSHLPLLLHPSPDSVYVLGLGTGITAGAALLHEVKDLTVSELIPEVVEASRIYFKDNINNLFSDDRARVIIEDGRHVLQNPSQQYDVVISDLFLPTVASDRLYTKEQFELVKSRLKKGGIFCQWLPLYQLTKPELKIITRTFMLVFPYVTLWRGNYSPNKPVIGLIGQMDNTLLDNTIIQSNLSKMLSDPQKIDSLWQTFLNLRGDRRGAQKSQAAKLSEFETKLIELMPYMLYVGNLSKQADEIGDGAINSDDKPIVAYRLAKQSLGMATQNDQWVIGSVLLQYLEEYQSLEHDPYLANLTEQQGKFILAGRSYHRSFIYKYLAYMSNNKSLDVQSKAEFENFLKQLNLTAQ